ncbi:MAG: hypothetical protein C4560_08870 [Nitrospiraceae bacterium]|nr:MAG: hypothetical protein C4560_08870 [Nitrospiraceae bacterium]
MRPSSLSLKNCFRLSKQTRPPLFISEDPIGFEGGINLYAYASNNPLLLIDPLGLEENLFMFWFGKSFSDHIAKQAWETGKTPNVFETVTYAYTEALKEQYNVQGYEEPLPKSLDEFKPWKPWPMEDLIDPYMDNNIDKKCSN